MKNFLKTNYSVPFLMKYSYFSATVGYIDYSFQLALYEIITPDLCKVHVYASEVLIALKKHVKSHWPRLTKNKVTVRTYLYNFYYLFIYLKIFTQGIPFSMHWF